MVMLLALVVPVLGLAAGVAVDYSRATSARSHLQAAADSMVLVFTHDLATINESSSTLSDRLNAYFKTNFMSTDSPNYTWWQWTGSIDLTSGNRVVSGQAGLKTTFLQLVGVKEIKVGVTAHAQYGAANLEIALVLDNTGSMKDDGRMTALKSAANDFLDDVAGTNMGLSGSVRISVVPFTYIIRVSTANKGSYWIDPEYVNMSAWQGCLWDREVPYGTVNTMPNPSISASKFHAVDPYDSKSVDKNTGQSYCSAQSYLLPLTSDINQVRSTINGMQPTGGTNIPVGLAWGWNMLTPGNLLSTSSTDPTIKKIMILLTDGKNVVDRYFADPSVIDSRTLTLCQNIKAAGITVYTIRLLEGDIGMLQQCASKSEYAFNITTASSLNSAFQKISAGFGRLRLAK